MGKKRSQIMGNTANTAATKLAAAALTAATELAAGIAKGNTAKGATLAKLFGPGADNTAATLAMRTARVMAGEAKLPAGGTGTRIGAVRKLVTAAHAAGDTAALTPRGYVTAARTVLDAHAAAQKLAADTAKGERAALAAKLNDRSARKSDRMVAASKLATIDATAQGVKYAAALDTLTAALTAGKGKGITATAVGELLESLYPGVSVTVTLPAVAAA
jgi:hypothetical protein